MIEDTGLVNQQYSWLTTIFYLAYLVGEFPSNFLLQRWSLGKSLSIYMLLWGESLLLTGISFGSTRIISNRVVQKQFVTKSNHSSQVSASSP